MTNAFAYWNGIQSAYETRFFEQWSDAFPGFRIFSKDDVVDALHALAPEYVDLFRDLAIPSCRSDICRFVMANEHGGLYTDCHFGFDDKDSLLSFVDGCKEHDAVVVENMLFRNVRPTERHLLISGFFYCK